MTTSMETHSTNTTMVGGPPQSSTSNTADHHHHHHQTSSSSLHSSRLMSLSITLDDADRMAEASKALHQCLDRLSPPPIADETATGTLSAVGGGSNSTNDDNKVTSNDIKSNDMTKDGKATTTTTTTTDATTDTTTNTTTWRDILHQQPNHIGNLLVHEMIVQAAATKDCQQHPLIQKFVPTMMKEFGLTELEAKAGLVLFCDLDKSSKLRMVFDILASHTHGTQSASTTATTTEAETTADTNSKQEKVDNDHQQKENACPTTTNSTDTNSTTTTTTTNDNDNDKNQPSTTTTKSSTSAATATTTTTTIEPSKLSQDGAQSLFQTILLAISSCIGNVDKFPSSSKDNNNVNDAAKNTTSAAAAEDGTDLSAGGAAGAPIAASITADEADVLGAPSFDSTSIVMATLKEEEEEGENGEENNDEQQETSKKSTHETTSSKSIVSPNGSNSKSNVRSLQEEVTDTAIKAAKALMEFAIKTSGNNRSVVPTKDEDTMITFDTFGEWYNSGGCSLVPWLELLHLSKWKVSKAPTFKPASNISSSAASSVTTSTQGTTLMSNTHHSKHPPVATLQVTATSAIKLKPPPHKKAKLQQEPPQQSLSSLLKEDAALMRARATGQYPPPPTHPYQHYHHQHHHHHPPHPPPTAPPSPPSRTVVSFDFASGNEETTSPNSSSKTDVKSQELSINISEENLWVLRGLVYRTGLIYRSAADVCKSILRLSHRRMHNGRPLCTLRREDFRPIVRKLLMSGSSNPKQNNAPLTPKEMDNFGLILEDFFTCFEGNSLGEDDPPPSSSYPYHQQYHQYPYAPLQANEVNAKELAVGFCFLCAGNKSTKLATGFELLDDIRSGYLSKQQLMRYLRSYLTMLVGMSQMKENHARRRRPLSQDRLREMRSAVENGARWTLRHFMTSKKDIVSKRGSGAHPPGNDAYSFETFANWYSKGGYQVAPWLELLDLNKLVSLIGESDSFPSAPQGPTPDQSSSISSYANGGGSNGITNQSSSRECRSSHRRKSHNKALMPTSQVLFTFPLANHRSLIVLREDATYVRGVVEQLGLLSFTPENIWNTFTGEIKKRPHLKNNQVGGKSRNKKIDTDKTTLMDKVTFLEVMELALQSGSTSGRKRSSAGTSKMTASVQEVLSNFFHSFDLKQSNLVAINELMGGLTLLCGGKKSTKLAFAFGVFDSRAQPKGRKGKNKHVPLKSQSLDREDMYLFLRSFLIVMFSCCCQTLDMSDSAVDRYIADTANMVADQVMQYQRHTRKKDRVDFDEFGEWYNEGGFEIAPWLELLDMKKWVLVDNFDTLDTQPGPPAPPPVPAAVAALPSPRPEHDPNCPPPPPEDVLDPSFFEGDNDLMQMDSMDEMDMILMQPSFDKATDMMKPGSKFAYSPSQDRHSVLAYPPPAVAPPPSQQENQPLKFHLMTGDNNSGDISVAISQRRIRHLRHILSETGLYKIGVEEGCKKILSHGSTKSKTTPISKDDFSTILREILDGKGGNTPGPPMDILCDLFSAIFFNNDDSSMQPTATELACAFTVLCHGRKSEKLEFAFDLLDNNKNGKLTREDVFKYLKSLLYVICAVATTSSLEDDEDGEVKPKETMAAATAAAHYAVDLVFKSNQGKEVIIFDDFASWYTNSGFEVCPWIELLDLRKWAFSSL